jgi:gas vesicle protein
MPTGPASTADEVADGIRSLVDRMVEAKVTKEMSHRGQEIAALLAERGTEVGERVEDAWRESAPARRRAAKQVARASRDAAKWSETNWRTSIRPALREMWSRRTLAIGAAGAAVPAGKELVDQAAARLGVKRREERHWAAFFLGLLIGAAAGAIVALLATPKPGREMRRELSARAGEIGEELATRAKEEWVPLFQRDQVQPTIEPSDTAGGRIPAEPESYVADAEGAAEASGIAAEIEDAPEESPAEVGPVDAETSDERAAEETAEAINEAFEPDTAERERYP